MSAVLEWMLRRQRQDHGAIAGDLVLVRDEPFLRPGSLVVDRQPWRVVRVGGELTLRAALLDDSPLVALVPPKLEVVADLWSRAWQHKRLEVAAEDIVAAATGVLCLPLEDAALRDRIKANPEEFQQAAARRIWSGPVVREADVRAVLGAGLGASTPEELLRTWLVKGTPGASEGLRQRLRETWLAEHDWLMQATQPGGLEALVTAGLLAPVARARVLVQDFAIGTDDDRAWRRLASLVAGALARDVRREPWARTAEALAARLDLDVREGLALALKAGFCAAALGLARRGEVLPEDLDDLRTHRAAEPEIVEFVEDLARLGRYVRSLEGPVHAPAAWARLGLEVAWADRAARRARRTAAELGGGFSAAAEAVFTRYLDRRDAQNQAFAVALAQREVEWFGVRPAGEGMSLHLLARTVLRPLVDAGRRVLLVVLDGCDASTLIELLEDLKGKGIGLKAPSLLENLGPWTGLLSPLPTITAMGRRAIFAGEIPNNEVLTEGESVALRTADEAAFARNRALEGVKKRLVLKGEVRETAGELRGVIAGGEALVAVVLNAVDDALASPRTTALGPWTTGALGEGVLDALRAALEAGFTVLVTADHGHTPFWRAERKVEGSRSASQRYAQEPLPGAVALKTTPWRAGTWHLLTRVGAHARVQKQGFHGGAGLEEVVVPLAFLGLEGALPEPPAWWTHDVLFKVETPAESPEVLPEGWWSAADPRFHGVLQYLDKHGVVTEVDIDRITSGKKLRHLQRVLDGLKAQASCRGAM
jgi:hypothetical protein